MPSKNTTSLGLNQWDASDKPVREDFVRDNTIINDKITQLNSDLTKRSVAFTETQNAVANYNNSYIQGELIFVDMLITLKCTIPAGSEYWLVSSDQIIGGGMKYIPCVVERSQILAMSFGVDRSVRITNSSGTALVSGTAIEVHGVISVA